MVTKHADFIDNDITDGNRVKADWLNALNTAVFSAIGDGSSAPATSEDVTNNITITQIGGTARSVKSHLKDRVHAQDFTGANDTAKLQAAFNSGAACVIVTGNWALTSRVDVPTGLEVIWDNVTLSGHFNDFLLRLLTPGEQKFSGKLIVEDTDASVVSAATTLTKGIAWGDASNAVHNVDTTGCYIDASFLAQAHYFGAFSWTNHYGVLNSYNCGQAGTWAVLFDNSAGNYPNNTRINMLKVSGTANATWNGKGAYFDGNGSSIGHLEVESIYSSNGATFASTAGFSVNGGYLEAGGAGQNVIINNGRVAFTGCFINCDFVLGARTPFTGCKFFNNALWLNATYTECGFPNSNQLSVDVTAATLDQFPLFGGPASNVPLTGMRGNFTEYAAAAPITPDIDYDGANHSLAGNTTITYANDHSGLFTKTAVGASYAGAVGWKVPAYLAGSRLYAWAIVRIPSGATGVSGLIIGMGGIEGTGSYSAASLNIGVTQVSNADKWILVVLPMVLPFTDVPNYGSNIYLTFEPSGNQAQNSTFYIGDCGVELGGLCYHNLNRNA